MTCQTYYQIIYRHCLLHWSTQTCSNSAVKPVPVKNCGIYRVFPVTFQWFKLISGSFCSSTWWLQNTHGYMHTPVSTSNKWLVKRLFKNILYPPQHYTLFLLWVGRGVTWRGTPKWVAFAVQRTIWNEACILVWKGRESSNSLAPATTVVLISIWPLLKNNM